MTPKEYLEKQFKYCGIDKYHAQGYKGKGVVILNHEGGTEHANMTTNILKQVAPEATIINANVGSRVSGNTLMYYTFTIEGIKYTPEEMYNIFKPDIMSVSFKGSQRDELLEERLKPLVAQGLVICNASANEGSAGVFAKYKNIDITIGAVTFKNDEDEPSITYFSSYDVDKISIDFMAFMGNGSGTSAASPFFAGQAALIMQKYGKMKRDELVQFLIPFTKDLGNPGIDNKHGYGIVIMPDKEVVKVEFKDTQEHWAKEDIGEAVENGILKGYPDGTFKPEQTVTRAEIAVIGNRILRKVLEILKKEG